MGARAGRRGETARGFPEEFGGRGEVGGSIAGFETLAFGDLSLLVKCGVQFGLFGGAVLHLGTRKHHEAYLGDITSLRLPGCFAMTETGHGSNVQQLATTATYDAATGEFVIPTPDDAARKDYIGNAARDGRMAAVFAQLIVGGEARGVHALLVPLRDDDNNVLPGIRIEDCGAKLGLDGVDNGRIWFEDVRVPRDNLLDRYATVSADGVYESAIENPTKRFFTMLGTLIQGRVSVCGASISATKVALAIAIRHAESRRQFGPPGEDEVVLLDYRTHQRRLLPALAKVYALHFAQEDVVARLHRVFTADVELDRERRELETLAAGLKAVATWHATATIQECREACGGMGYLKGNRFAALKADTDVFTTFEGDNTVLAPARRQEPADRLPRPTRRAGPARHRQASSPAKSSRPSPSAARCARCSRAWPTTCCPAATIRPTSPAARSSWSCCAGALVTSARASRAGSKAASTAAASLRGPDRLPGPPHRRGPRLRRLLRVGAFCGRR